MDRVLIVDKARDLALEQALATHSFDVVYAESGSQAIAAAQEHKPAIALSEILLPDIDGFSLCQTWKRDPRVQSIPFLFHSASSFTEAFILETVGADGFLQRPCSTEDLIKAIETALRPSRPTSTTRPDAVHTYCNSRIAQLEELNACLQASFNASQSVIVTVSPQGRIIEANRAAEELYGRNRSQLLDADYYGFVPLELQNTLRRIIAEACAGKISERTYELHTATGGAVIHWHFTPFITPNQEVGGVIISGIDIREQELMGDWLKREHDFNTRVLDTLDALVVVLDEEGRIALFNGACERCTGYTYAEVKGEHVWDRLLLPEEQEGVMQVWNSIISSGEDSHYENAWVGKHGRARLISWSNTVLERSDCRFFLSTGIDITEQRHLEMQLLESRKMESITNLAGGVAHRFNNALAGIVGNIELLDRQLPEDTRTGRCMEHIHKSVDVMTDLTTQLLSYARGGRYRPETIAFGSFIENTLSLMTGHLTDPIQVRKEIPDDTWYVEADPTQMQLVISAILDNALEAIDGDGIISISCQNNSDHPGGPRVCTEISDSGRGMDAPTLEKVFDPFFTTKFHGRGLSMSAVYGIVSKHGGDITIDSCPDRGTKVRICLPALVDYAPQNETTETSTPVGSGTILLVEDEEVVAEASRELLEDHGYMVLLATTGKEAISTASSFGSIDLVLLDMVLPDMSGKEIFTELTRLQPNIKVLVCSGYAVDGPADEVLKMGARGFLQKPFRWAALSRRIREVLEEP